MILKPYMKTFSGDTETPITLYYKYVGEEIGFLLESRTYGTKGRYSFMGKNPKAVLSGKDKLIIDESGIKKECSGKLINSVKEYLENFNVIEADTVPFVGGAVGCIAYDTIRQCEKLPDKNPDVLKMPDIHMMVVTEIICYDHMHSTISIIVLESPDDEGKMKAEKKIEEIEKQLLKPVPQSIYEFNDSKNTKITFTSNRTKEEYMQMVEKAKKYIYEGDIFQLFQFRRISGGRKLAGNDSRGQGK